MREGEGKQSPDNGGSGGEKSSCAVDMATQKHKHTTYMYMYNYLHTCSGIEKEL